MICITNVGVFAERCFAIARLREMTECQGMPQQSPLFEKVSLALLPKAAVLDAEDAAYLSDASTALRNAIADALGALPRQWSDGNEDLAVFAATDTSEMKLTGIQKLFEHHPVIEDALRSLGETRRYTHPFDTFRMLSTNAVYHVSKQLDAHGGGYPVQAMSLSGLCALEDAMDGLLTGRAPQRAMVAAYGNMRNIEPLTTFTRMGLVKEQGCSQVDPTYAAVALFLQRRDDGDGGLAELLAAQTFYIPKPIASVQTWCDMLAHARDQIGNPDYIVRYDNGVFANGRNEREALRQVFPDVATRHYKKALGYTGKANNLLDLAAALSDPTIAPGSVVVVCGAGLMFGVGYLAMRKLAPAA